MRESAEQNSPDSTVEPQAGWRELLARRYMPQLLVLGLAIWLHAANSMLAATTLPEAVGEIGGLRLISWAFALYLMGSIVAATAISACVASIRPACRTMLASTLVYTRRLRDLRRRTGRCRCCSPGARCRGWAAAPSSRWSTSPRTASFPNRLVPQHHRLPLGRVDGYRRSAGRSSAARSPPPACGATPSGPSPCRACSSPRPCIRCSRGARPGARCAGPAEFPIVRLALVACAIFAISTAGTMSSPPPAAVFLLLGCACLVFFVVRDSAAPERTRLLPAHATNLDHPVGSGISMMFVLCLCMMSFLVYGPILLILLYDLTPLQAGLVVLTESLGWTAGAVLLSGLAPGRVRWLVRIGSAMLLAGLAAQAWFLPNGPLWLIVASAFLGHAGLGIMFGHVIRRIIANVDPADRDRAGSMLPSAQQTGFALGAALSGMIANGLGFERITDPEEYRTAAFWLFATFVPLALLGNLLAWRFSNRIDGTTMGGRAEGSSAA